MIFFFGTHILIPSKIKEQQKSQNIPSQAWIAFLQF